jgi:hypothetical protein
MFTDSRGIYRGNGSEQTNAAVVQGHAFHITPAQAENFAASAPGSSAASTGVAKRAE